MQVTRQSVKSGIINQTLPLAPRGKLRWMPKMWLHHHIDSEHKCSFRFAVSGLRTLPVTSSRPATYYTGTSIPLPVNYAKWWIKKIAKASLVPSWPRSCATSLLSSSSSSSLLLWYHKRQRHGQRGGGGESSLDRGLCEHDGPDSREWDVSKNKRREWVGGVGMEEKRGEMCWTGWNTRKRVD